MVISAMSVEEYNPKNEFSIYMKSMSVFRGPKYDSFYIIGQMAECKSNLIKFKYFSTKHDIFAHRGVFRVITKNESTMDTYKKDPISCFTIDSIFPEYTNEIPTSFQTPNNDSVHGVNVSKQRLVRRTTNTRPSYHPYITKDKPY